MSGFDHRDRGTPEGAWQLADLPRMDAPGPGEHVLVLAAHPDDETLGAGGLLARCAQDDVPVTVVVASDGEASHPSSRTASPAQLARRRRDEVRAAVSVLAPGCEVRFLGLPDGALTEHRDTLIEQVEQLVGAATLIVSPWAGDRHPDHEACARAAAAIARRRGLPLWQYPIWMWHWARPDGPEVPVAQLARVDLDAAAHDTKADALACHVSQHRPLSAEPGDEAILPPEIVAHFARTFECFVVGDAAPAAPSDAG
ncbi:PIG-L deacetylase family protein [uncultured Jatrophihabitans sp.]|uniref:PIG-L deacetylase family protein n=1 Tax=uncultured Jatrophihabitans sp. TaxID=1610747 RepID=UPI0035CA306E